MQPPEGGRGAGKSTSVLHPVPRAADHVATRPYSGWWAALATEAKLELWVFFPLKKKKKILCQEAAGVALVVFEPRYFPIFLLNSFFTLVDQKCVF